MSLLYLNLYKHNLNFTFGAVDEWWHTLSLDAHLHSASQTEGIVAQAKWWENLSSE